MKLSQSFLLIVFVLFLNACGNDKHRQAQKIDVVTSNQPSKLNFYKNIEIRPGLNYEIISWGKGIDTLGGYTVCMSDSSKRRFKAINFERKGKITDVWAMDLDTDGNPEFYIQVLTKKNQLDLEVVEFLEDNFKKIPFPSLSSKTKAMYHGNDKFFVKEGSLLRQIPLLEVNNEAKHVKIDTVKYTLIGKRFSVSGYHQKK